MNWLRTVRAASTSHSLWYLGTPYSKFPDGIDAAFQGACRAAADLVRLGIHVYCPIAHTHPIAVHGNIDPFDHEVWMALDRKMMTGCCGLLVCQMPTWEESTGLRIEQEEFAAAGKPVLHIPYPVGQ